MSKEGRTIVNRDGLMNIQMLYVLWGKIKILQQGFSIINVAYIII